MSTGCICLPGVNVWPLRRGRRVVHSFFVLTTASALRLSLGSGQNRRPRLWAATNAQYAQRIYHPSKQKGDAGSVDGPGPQTHTLQPPKTKPFNDGCHVPKSAQRHSKLSASTTVLFAGPYGGAASPAVPTRCHHHGFAHRRRCWSASPASPGRHKVVNDAVRDYGLDRHAAATFWARTRPVARVGAAPSLFYDRCGSGPSNFHLFTTLTPATVFHGFSPLLPYLPERSRARPYGVRWEPSRSPSQIWFEYGLPVRHVQPFPRHAPEGWRPNPDLRLGTGATVLRLRRFHLESLGAISLRLRRVPQLCGSPPRVTGVSSS